MELKIANKESNSIAEKFGISAFRRDELLNFVEQRYYEVANSCIMTPLVQHYTSIANFCKNVEEYTLCMRTKLIPIATCSAHT